jgi:hypothetical protein
VSLPLNSIKFMVIGCDERDVQSFRKRQRKGVRKGDSFFDFNDSDPLDKYIIQQLFSQVQVHTFGLTVNGM